MNNPATIDGFIIGINEGAYLGDGWHARQLREPDKTPFRAIEPHATFHLSLPSSKSLRLKILMSAPVCYMGGSYKGKLLMGKKLLGEIAIDNDNWVLREFDLPEIDKAAEVEFTIESQTNFIPAKALKNNDFRTIGCNIAAILIQS